MCYKHPHESLAGWLLLRLGFVPTPVLFVLRSHVCHTQSTLVRFCGCFVGFLQVMELDNRLQKAGSDAVKKEDDHRKALAQAAQVAQAAAAATAAAAPAAIAAQPGQPAPAAAAALANGGPPPGAAAADGSMLNSMRKQVGGLMQNFQSQAPGYARVMADSLQGAAAAVMGGPEHVPQPAGRGSMPGMQETELERKTRELQVRCAGSNETQ